MTKSTMKSGLLLGVECGAAANQSYAAEGTFTVETTTGKETRVQLSVDESGDGPQYLARKKTGTFDVRVRADVDAKELVAK